MAKIIRDYGLSAEAIRAGLTRSIGCERREERGALIAECLRIADRYRNAAERMLSLPYGSLELIGIPMLKSLCGNIHAHWARSLQ